MKVINKYQHPELQLCRECKGDGNIYLYHPDDMLNMGDTTTETCPLCKGSGRVWVSKNIEIKIEPMVQN